MKITEHRYCIYKREEQIKLPTAIDGKNTVTDKFIVVNNNDAYADS